MPLSPSMKVMADLHAPVLPYAGSTVMAPVSARSLAMSMPTSPSDPTVTGQSIFLSSMVMLAARDRNRPLASPSDATQLRCRGTPRLGGEYSRGGAQTPAAP